MQGGPKIIVLRLESVQPGCLFRPLQLRLGFFGKLQKISGMPPLKGRPLVAAELFVGELAQGLQKPEPHLLAGLLGEDQ